MSKRILVVDDEEILTRSFSRLLEKAGYEVFTAKNGGDAVVYCDEADFDLIICDVRMPGLNGVDAIKNILEKKKINVIFITGYADANLEKSAKELNPVAYLSKPFDVQNLLQIVKKQLGI